MQTPRRAVVLIAWLGLWPGAGCSLASAGKGEACTRSTQCATGLACIYPTGGGQAKEGKCGGDLSSLNDPSQVPKLTPPDAAADAAADGGDAAAADNDGG